MDDLIKRQAAIDAHYEYCNKHPDAGFPVWSLKILEDLPSAQPGIIHCRECKHYNAGFECLIEGYGIERNKDWYCADAERRTDE